MVLCVLLRGDQHRCWVEELPTVQIHAHSRSTLCSRLLYAQNIFPKNTVPCRCCSWAGTAKWRLEGQRLASKKPLQWTWLVLQLCRPVAVTCCCRFKPGGIAVWAGREGQEAACIIVVVIQILSNAKLPAVRFQSFSYVFPMPRTSTNLKLNF